MKTCYDRQLKIWIVGVRDRAKSGSIWSMLWKPTSLKWFSTRKECQTYINNEIFDNNKEFLEYKPIRYNQI